MRSKTCWYSLAIALFVTAAVSFLEQRRGVYFLERRGAKGKGSIDYRLALAVQQLEWAALDWRFRIRGSRKSSGDIAIVAIDDKSISELHQWPWPRRFHARLINQLHAAPPKALIFDVLFVDPSTADPIGDRALVSATRENPWVIHALYFKLQDHRVTGVEWPFPALHRAAPRLGYVNAATDEDGVLRSARLEWAISGRRVPLLSVAGASLFFGGPWESVVRRVPAGRQGEMLINFVGGAGAFAMASYADVLSGKVPPDSFRGKIVLVGSTATGAFDHYPTPTSNLTTGVEFHANVIDNLLGSRALRYHGLPFTFAVIAAFGLLAGVVLARSTAGIGALWILALGLSYWGASQWFFSHHNSVVDAAGPLLTLGACYVAILGYRLLTEEREKRWVKALFGQYVSSIVLDEIMKDPSKLELGGERRELTVYFSDVAGFTSISERLDPERLVALLNRYLTAMTEVVFACDGYLNKYMGDGIMAFWNAPVRQADHAERSCLCALRCLERLKALNQELARQGLAPLQTRIGINSGVAVVGNMGSAQKSDYTAMGDSVNLGSRLEGANKAFGSAIMISEFTYERVHERFEVRFLDHIRVAGRAKPVKTYELLGEKGSTVDPWSQALPLYHEAIQEFAARRFDRARVKFLEVIRIVGQDKPSEMYIQRAEAFQAHPPAEDWDGVLELLTK